MMPGNSMDRWTPLLPIRLLSIVALAWAGLALTGIDGSSCAAEADDAALVAAAKNEGHGTFYSNMDPTAGAEILASFKARYGIQVDLERLTSGPLLQRFSAEMEGNMPTADVFLSTDRLYMQASEAKGWFAVIADLPAVKRFPASAKTGRTITIGYIPFSLVWNTNEVKRELTDWKELTRPEFRDRLLLIDPRGVSLSSLAFYSLMRRTYGDEFLKSIGNNASFTVSVVPGLQQIAAGAKAIYAPAIHQVTVPLQKKNAPLGESFPAPTTSTDNIVAVSSKAPHPNVARLLINYLCTSEAQAILNRDGFSPLTGVPGTRPLPQMETADLNVVKNEGSAILRLLGLH
jgi:iron(III) transport system substrate-binding protein